MEIYYRIHVRVVYKMAVFIHNYIQLSVTVIPDTTKDVSIIVNDNMEQVQLEKRIPIIVIENTVIKCYVIVNSKSTRFSIVVQNTGII